VADVEINEVAMTALLHDIAFVVTSELAEDVANTARTISPQRPHGGSLRRSVRTIEGSDGGVPYADVVSLWYGRFLDPKARQLRRLHPFLPSALYAVVDGRTFHF
jgi:hypothetical protein